MVRDGEKTLGGCGTKNKRGTECNANEWVDYIDLKVIFHKLLSKSSHLLPEAKKKEKNRKMRDLAARMPLWCVLWTLNLYLLQYCEKTCSLSADRFLYMRNNENLTFFPVHIECIITVCPCLSNLPL